MNVLGRDLRGDGIHSIGTEYKPSVVATLIPDSVITKKDLAKRWGDCKAHAGGYHVSWNPKVCSTCGAAVQGKTAGNSISKVVGEVLH